ncbi:L-fucose-proton symporter [Posidoniimonas polymericola]|uniref:L-fucose-proton symporter n=1 Tax=Posidoniimonas polymericola TaxID=2528002 RepID=A0A5C5YMV8_9BACT|nr:L-fucose:H+ symporter permease [Posidoniimonas polymericola]TWT76147.1 L-fucose-proton symporter [Posidoniimonas polymericola]
MSQSTPPSHGSDAVVPSRYLAPFILVTSLFALWGFANDITNPMVAAFKNVLLLSHFESSLVQAAFYGGYCVMAIPAALFIRRFGYKSGVIMGLALYAAGCLLFVPAGKTMLFSAFLGAYFIMTCGLAFLETTANPYILAMGPDHNAARRLNFAQAFNPVGSICGMFVAKEFILARLDKADEAARLAMSETDPAGLLAIQQNDLGVIVTPYVVLGCVVGVVFLAFALAPLPTGETYDVGDKRIGAQLGRLFTNRRYVEGVIAQAFYVGAQIMCWTFIIQYAEDVVNMPKENAQGLNMVAMGIFIGSRWICTYLMKYFQPAMMLATFAAIAILLVLGVILLPGQIGLGCLIGVSACMSLMFPTIYGIALEGLGDDAKLASAGLICAIGGGCVMPPLQASIMDLDAFNFGAMTLSSTRVSFILPLICFVVVGLYGLRSRHRTA